MVASVTLSEAASAATAVGVLFAAGALFLQRNQARTAFEDGIADRYRHTVKPHLVSSLVLVHAFRERSEDERRRLLDAYLYLDLCNEQVFLRAIGRVSRATWRVQWVAGIRDNLTHPAPIAHYWSEIRTATDDFRELRAYEDNQWKDPRSWEPFWRRPFATLGVLTLRVPQISPADKAASHSGGEV